MLLLSLTLILSTPADSARCGPDASARVDAASDLIDQAFDADPIDKAAVLERARILLERTLEDEPDCRAAVKLKAHADGLHQDMEALSSAAAQEAVLVRAADTVTVWESGGVTDPDALQALRFQLAALHQLRPDDARVTDLNDRARALGVTP